MENEYDVFSIYSVVSLEDEQQVLSLLQHLRLQSLLDDRLNFSAMPAEAAEDDLRDDVVPGGSAEYLHTKQHFSIQHKGYV